MIEKNTIESIVGPRAHERESRLVIPQNVQLEDGTPLYHALLKNPDAMIVSPSEIQAAKGLLSQIIATNPERVLACKGKTREEAMEILKSQIN